MADQADPRRLADALVRPPRNPARMPQGVEDFAYGATVEPFWDMAKGVGALASGAGNVPEVGAGLMSAIFAGPMARTANRAALQTAETMAARGANRTDIWNQTGWFKGIDDKWRFEIPDNQLNVAGHGYGEGLGGSGPVRHTALRDAYPAQSDEIGSSIFRSDKDYPSGIFGTTSDGRPAIGVEARLPQDARSPVAHELQHFVQSIEGFQRGGNPDDMLRRAERVMIENGIDPAAPHVRGLSVERANNSYRRLAGEVEARNVQTRLDMTPEQRQSVPPWMTEDIPADRQLVRRTPPGTEASTRADMPLFDTFPPQVRQAISNAATDIEPTDVARRLQFMRPEAVVDYIRAIDKKRVDSSRLSRALEQ